jgi:hypothetical protein
MIEVMDLHQETIDTLRSIWAIDHHNTIMTIGEEDNLHQDIQISMIRSIIEDRHLKAFILLANTHQDQWHPNVDLHHLKKIFPKPCLSCQKAGNLDNH